MSIPSARRLAAPILAASVGGGHRAAQAPDRRQRHSDSVLRNRGARRQAALELTGSRKLHALVGALRGGDDKAIAATAHAFEAEFAEVVREHVGHLLATVAEVLVTTLCHEQPWKLVATESVRRRAEERLDGLFRTLLDDVMHNVALTSPPLAHRAAHAQLQPGVSDR